MIAVFDTNIVIDALNGVSEADEDTAVMTASSSAM